MQKWEKFLDDASGIMRAALNNQITLEKASEFFERADAIENEDLRQFLVRYIWEIDGSPKYYREILDLLENKVSQERLLRYFTAYARRTP